MNGFGYGMVIVFWLVAEVSLGLGLLFLIDLRDQWHQKVPEQ